MEVSGRKADEGSDSLPQIQCTPCHVDDKHVDAQGYCETCQHYLCEHCYKYHNIPVPTKHHILVDKSQMPVDVPAKTSVEVALCTDLCPSHEGEYIKYFCNRHSQLACSACVTLDHQDCKGRVAFIPTIAKTALDNKEYKNMKKRLQDKQTSVEMMQKRFEQNIKPSQQKNNESTSTRTILKLKEDMKGLIVIDAIVDDMQDTIKYVLIENMTLVQKQVDSCQRLIAAIGDCLRRLERTETRRAALFVAIMTEKPQLISFQKQITDLEQNEVLLSCKFVPNEETLTDQVNRKIIEQLAPDIKAMQSQLKDTVEKIHERDDIIQKLNADLHSLKTKHQQHTLKQWQTEMDRKTDTIKMLQDSLKQCQIEMDQKTDTVNRYQDFHKQCQTELDQKSKTDEKEVHERDDIIQKLNVDVHSLNAKYQQKIHETDKQTDTVKRLQDSLKQGQTQMDVTTGTVQRLQECLKQCQTEMDQKTDTAKRLQDSLKQCQTQMDQKTYRVTRLQDSLMQCHTEMDQERKVVTEEIRDRDEIINELKVDLGRSKTKYQELLQEAGEQSTIIKKLNADLVRSNSKYQEQLEEADKQEGTIERRNADLDRPMFKLQEQLEEVDILLDKPVETIKKQQDSNKQLQPDLDEMKMVKCVACKRHVVDHKLLPCGHAICWACLNKKKKKKLKCPACGMITGNQPEGTMDVIERESVITIQYWFAGGVQTRDHPWPGTPYRGMVMIAYLKDDEEGRTLLDRLRTAWDRKLLFTVGASRNVSENGMKHCTNQSARGWPVISDYRESVASMKETLKKLGVTK